MTKVANKKIEEAWWRYNHGWNVVDDIYKAYNKPSSRKVQAWEYCKHVCDEFNGTGLRVISHGCHFFSAGFVFDYHGRKMFGWITPSHDYCCDVTDMAI